MKLHNVLKKTYNTLATQLYRLTSKRTVMKLTELFDTPVMTRYHHIVSALRYVAVEEHYGENDFGKNLYITSNHYENDAAMQTDLAHFDALIKSIETKGYNMSSTIYTDLDKNCFNGTHRLALCAWFGVEQIPAYIVRRHLKTPTIQEMKIYYRLSDEDFAKLEAAYQRMYARIHKN